MLSSCVMGMVTVYCVAVTVTLPATVFEVWLFSLLVLWVWLRPFSLTFITKNEKTLTYRPKLQFALKTILAEHDKNLVFAKTFLFLKKTQID